MDIQKPDIRELMSTHHAELMANAELYGWEAIQVFHAIWLQQMEQGKASWKDGDIKLTYHHALVWHQPADGRKLVMAAAPGGIPPRRPSASMLRQ